MSRSDDLLQIIQHSIRSVRPDTVFPKLLSAPPFDEIRKWIQSPERFLLAIGKAGISSAEVILRHTPCRDSFVLAPKPARETSIPVRYGSHPLPDEDSAASTVELVAWLRSLPATASLLVVLSGGSSALLVSPVAGISLAEKRKTNELLVGCGASIQEINAVRKHLSRVKGGQLAQLVAPERTLVLVISDVIGDDLSTIGSGPFYPDPTTYLEARDVLTRYGIWEEVPSGVHSVLEQGMEGKLPETPKQLSPPIPHRIVTSNEVAREAAAARARELGYAVKTFGRPIHGMVEDVAASLVSFLRQLSAQTAMIVGGEITVRVGNSGIGGRNQHLALMITEILAGSDAVFAAVGTDGVDGNSPAAGAWTDGHTLSRAMRKKIDINRCIEHFDSYRFFDELQQTIHTGPTGTNVMDLYLALT